MYTWGRTRDRSRAGHVNSPYVAHVVLCDEVLDALVDDAGNYLIAV